MKVHAVSTGIVPTANIDYRIVYILLLFACMYI